MYLWHRMRVYLVSYQSVVVITSLCKLLEILTGSGGVLSIQLNDDVSYGGLQLDLWCCAESHTLSSSASNSFLGSCGASLREQTSSRKGTTSGNSDLGESRKSTARLHVQPRVLVKSLTSVSMLHLAEFALCKPCMGSMPLGRCRGAGCNRPVPQACCKFVMAEAWPYNAHNHRHWLDQRLRIFACRLHAELYHRPKALLKSVEKVSTPKPASLQNLGEASVTLYAIAGKSC